MGIAAFPLGICSQSSAPDLEGQGSAAHQWCCIAQVASVLNQQDADLKHSVSSNYTHGINPCI